MHETWEKVLRPFLKNVKVPLVTYGILSGFDLICPKWHFFMFFTEKVQQSGNGPSFWHVLTRFCLNFMIFLDICIPRPQAYESIFVMFGQKQPKNCHFGQKLPKNAQKQPFLPKSGQKTPLKVSLFDCILNMDTGLAMWVLVFKMKEAWWTAGAA